MLTDHFDRGSGIEGYSGIHKMSHRLENESPFVPIYGGLIIHRQTAVVEKTSASEGYIIHYDSQGHEVYLASFNITEPHYIDVTMSRPDGGDITSIVSSSYINGPADPGIYLVDADGNWRRHYDSVHGTAASVAPAGYPLPNLQPVPNSRYAHGTNNFMGSFASLTYDAEVAMFYGRFRDMVFVQMFPPNSGVVPFTSPQGGGGHLDGTRNPAWDWRFLNGKGLGLNGDRLRMPIVYKPFIDEDDILREYGRWVATL